MLPKLPTAITKAMEKEYGADRKTIQKALLIVKTANTQENAG